MKIKFNDNLISIYNFILSSEQKIDFEELFIFVRDYQLYEEYYLNYHIIKDLLDSHNKKAKENFI